MNLSVIRASCDSTVVVIHTPPSPGSLVEKDGTINPPCQQNSLIFKHSHTHTLVWMLVSEVVPDTLPRLPPSLRGASSSSPLPVRRVISLCCFILAG